MVATLQSRGCGEIFAPRKRDYDLPGHANTRRLFQDVHPDIVMHLAGTVGGVGANRTKPGTFFLRKRYHGD